MTTYLRKMNRRVRFQRLQERVFEAIIPHIENICTLAVMIVGVACIVGFWLIIPAVWIAMHKAGF